MAHYERALALYNPEKHRHLARRFGQDASVSILGAGSWNRWFLGYPAVASRDADQALKTAREIGQAASLMFALSWVVRLHILCGRYSVANVLAEELFALAQEKGALQWKAFGLASVGCTSALTNKYTDAVQRITSGLSAYHSLGGRLYTPMYMSDLASAYANLSDFGAAWRCINEAQAAMETTGEAWFKVDINRIAGEIALKSPQPDVAKAEGYFERALAVAREQQAKSWELRAAMSMARLWRDQGKPQRAHELLAPVYGWFTEGFDTLDLQVAKTLLATLA
jgi:predicted ATPase